MADTDTTSTALDNAFAGVVDALVELMRSGVRPDVLEAQRLLLQRLAQQGDVFPSRVPAPLNITEVGGYLNLLESAGQLDMRASAVASALGVAGPAPGSAALGGVVPVGFVEVANDRPAGAAQASIPPLLSVRADFHAPLQTALATLHASGCALPLRAPRATLPANQPGATATSLDLDLALAALGRSLEVFPGTLLVDPTSDALAIARPETPATEPLRLVARTLDGSTMVAEASWVAVRASATGIATDAPTAARYLEVAPVLQTAGWLHPQPLVAPTALASRGTLVRFVNVTGLVPGETTLGAELALLYPPAAIARSAFAALTAWVWDGSSFAAPV
ncbi:MAG: hypothetical protein H0W48_05710 [Methylibium sp.]|uniref:hypothetical protein n=1 Tax=Methylibium sp. TaxID=2067992 RepID=UPI0017F3B07F|nr:hypothetical protein [Methylibium sp.]MBA2724096.1 hypothetical protein [Methylibium sp.]MBA3591961.1 hypothetical protein [Methylibium sp.]MBA3623940.1 hypothetical protein [Methylibium sp.]